MFNVRTTPGFHSSATCTFLSAFHIDSILSWKKHVQSWGLTLQGTQCCASFDVSVPGRPTTAANEDPRLVALNPSLVSAIHLHDRSAHTYKYTRHPEIQEPGTYIRELLRSTLLRPTQRKMRCYGSAKLRSL